MVGWTALHISTHLGKYVMSELLLWRGADVEKVTWNGDTVISLAKD